MYPRRVPGSEADACLWLLSTAAWGLFQRVVLGGGVRQLGICRLVTVYWLWGEEIVGVVSSILVEVVGWYHGVHVGTRVARSSRRKGGEGRWKLGWY